MQVVLLIVHIGAAMLLVFTRFAWWQILAAQFLVAGYAVILFSHLGFIRRIPIVEKYWPRIVAFQWDENDQWLLEDANGQQHRAELLPTTVVHPRIVAINFTLPDQAWLRRRCSLVVLSDSISEEDFRRLRVRLRWYPGIGEDNLEEQG